MTTKQEVNLEIYQKAPRMLEEPMEVALGPGGGLHQILVAVAGDDRLRLDIRDRRFNVYYGGGNLMRVDGRKSPWELHFDEKYFKGGTLQPPVLPPNFLTTDDACAWVQAFPKLIAGMEYWWSLHPKGEKAHCQAMAATNSGTAQSGDYLVLDLEYQWAQRRFDMVAAKRRLTEDDATGWAEPDLVFVEVKCTCGACSDTSGLSAHANDYRDIIKAKKGGAVHDIKLEFETVVAQKVRLGLFDRSLGFMRFSPKVSELLLVLIDIDPNASSMKKPLSEVRGISNTLDDTARIRYMCLDSPDYKMTSDAEVPQKRLVAKVT